MSTVNRVFQVYSPFKGPLRNGLQHVFSVLAIFFTERVISTSFVKINY